jgi:hypothetical protein
MKEMLKWPERILVNKYRPSKISEGKTGLTKAMSVSLAMLASRNPSTSLWYSFSNLLLSFSFMLKRVKKVNNSEINAHPVVITLKLWFQEFEYCWNIYPI